MKTSIIVKSNYKNGKHKCQIIRKSMKSLNKTEKLCELIDSIDDVIEYVDKDQENDFIKNSFSNKHNEIVKDEDGYTMVFGRKDVKRTFENRLNIPHKKCNALQKDSNLSNVINAFLLGLDTNDVITYLKGSNFEITEVTINSFRHISYKILSRNINSETDIVQSYLFANDDSEFMISFEHGKIKTLTVINAKGDSSSMNKQFLQMIEYNSIKELDIYITYSYMSITYKNRLLFMYSYSSISDSIILSFGENEIINNNNYEQIYKMRG